MEWGGRVLQDGVEDVFMFLDDQEGGSEGNGMSRVEREELPTGVMTLLTKCYSVTCDEENPCYSYACPRKVRSLPSSPHSAHRAPGLGPNGGDWGMSHSC